MKGKDPRAPDLIRGPLPAHSGEVPGQARDGCF